MHAIVLTDNPHHGVCESHITLKSHVPNGDVSKHCILYGIRRKLTTYIVQISDTLFIKFGFSLNVTVDMIAKSDHIQIYGLTVIHQATNFLRENVFYILY